MKESQSNTISWILFWTFWAIYVLTCLGCLGMLFFGFGTVLENERGILINTFLVETAVAIFALYYSIFKLKNVRKGGTETRSSNHNSNSFVVLNAARTKEFVKMYQRSLAYAISREIDETLSALMKNPSSYDRDFFIDRIWSITLNCRAETLHFSNKELGLMRDYFEKGFPEDELRRVIVDHYEKILLDFTTDPIERRRKLFDAIEIVQSRLYDKIIAQLDE